MMKRYLRSAAGAPLVVVVALAIFLAAVSGRQAQAAEYAVIVNAGNPDAAQGEALKEVVKRLYLKEQTNWPSGTPARPLARPDGSPAQQAFVAEVLGMDGAAYDQHWLHLKQTKGETPPRAVGSALIVKRLVSKYPGAFSVLSAAEMTDLPEGVTVLFRFDH